MAERTLLAMQNFDAGIAKVVDVGSELGTQIGVIDKNMSTAQRFGSAQGDGPGDFRFSARIKFQEPRVDTPLPMSFSHTSAQLHGISRRDAVKQLSAGALLASGLWPSVLQAASGGSFRFATINDTHYKTPACGEWMRKVVDRIKAEAPAFCLHLGDLTDLGDRESLGAMRELLGDLGVPFYTVIGNHDYAVIDESAVGYEEFFPDRINYGFEHAGWQFVGLDTTDRLLWHDTRISDRTLEWVDNLLPRLDPQRPLVVFTHFPLASGIDIRPVHAVTKFRMQPVNAPELLAKFEGQNLRGVLSGHFHGFTEERVRDATVATHRCCGLVVENHDGTTEKGFTLYTAENGRLARRFCGVS
ncbi:MAG TPA: metallophosphoesterase [Opitutus sp.]|nr:metallophosphoesterase [Opitutus sp.]